MSAIVLAGGKSRLVNELYPDTPAPLIPVDNAPFLQWVTLWIKQQGFKNVIYSAAHQAEKIELWASEFANAEPELHLDVLTEEKPLGTGGATAHCAHRFPAPILLVLNGDSLVLTNIKAQHAMLQADEHLDGVILARHSKNAGRFGALTIDEQSILTEFNEKQPGEGLVNAGVYLLKQSLFTNVADEVSSSLEYECFPKWLKEGKRIKVLDCTACDFIDVGAPNTLAKAQAAVEVLKPLTKTSTQNL